MFTITINLPLTGAVAKTTRACIPRLRGFRCASQKPESGVYVTAVITKAESTLFLRFGPNFGPDTRFFVHVFKSVCAWVIEGIPDNICFVWQ